MKKLYSLLFCFVLVLMGCYISNVNAVHLSDTDGKIPVTRVITKVHNPVNATFNYKITAGSNNPKEVSGFSNASVTFNNVRLTISGNNWFGEASSTGVIDLTGIDFTKAGDYTFKVEENSDDGRFYHKDFSIYTITIAVRRNTDTSATGDNLNAKLAYITSNAKKEKVDNITFTGEASFDSFSISKEVKGNMANVNEYFKIKVNVPTCKTGDEYFIYYYKNPSGVNESSLTKSIENKINYKGSTIDRMLITDKEDLIDYFSTDTFAKYTCGQDNYIYLKSGEVASISGIVGAFTYRYVEQDAENYKTYINNSNNDSKDSGILRSSYSDGSVDEGYPQVYYNMNTISNVYERSVLTGVAFKSIPYTILVIGIVSFTMSLVYLNKKKKKGDMFDEL